MRANNFITWCHRETSNLTASCPPSGILIELARRILVLASVIIPLIALFTHAQEKAPSIAEFRQRLAKKIPNFFYLVQSYQQEKRVSKLDYTALNKELSSITDVTKLFKRIRKKLGMENHIFLQDETAKPTNLFAYLLANPAHNSLAISLSTFFMVCPEYTADGNLSRFSEPLTDDLVPSQRRIEVRVSELIGTNNTLLRGKIPNHNNRALETCISLFAYLLQAPLR